MNAITLPSSVKEAAQPKQFWLTNILRHALDPLEFSEYSAREYGDVVKISLPRTRGVLMFHPTAIEEVFTKKSQYFIKSRMTRNLELSLGNSLLVSDGDFWRQQRRLIQPAFHQQRINSYASIMVEYTKRLTQEWQHHEVRDIHSDMMTLTLLIVSKVLFDADLRNDAHIIGDALEFITQYHMGFLATGLNFPLGIPTIKNLRFKHHVQRLNTIVYRIINKRRKEPDFDYGDLLSMLLMAQENGQKMSDEQIRHEAITMILAGHETTALALTYTLYLLSQHPDKKQRLQEELQNVLQGRDATLADYAKLQYTENVIKEAMRMYPPVWAIGREATEDCEIDGYFLPKQTQVMLFQWVTQRDARFFNQPLEFQPERWQKEKPNYKFAYFPFGGGTRLCIGSTFAMMEATLILATMMQQFEMQRISDKPLKLVPSITLRPKNGLPMKLLKL